MMAQESKYLESHSPASCCAADIDRLFPTELFRAFSDTNRVALFGMLAASGDPKTVTEASSCCPTDMSVVSRHLAVLRDAGIVEAQKRGRQVFYRVRYGRLSAALRAMADAIDACCPPERKEPGDRTPADENKE